MRPLARWGAIVLALVTGAGLAAPAGRAIGTAGQPGQDLDLYRITAPAAEVAHLARTGIDVAATRPDGTTEVVLGPGELTRLTAAGLHPVRWRDARGRSVADLARIQAAGTGPVVWKRWDGPGGL
ncbi:MAG: hypothetical protein LC792_26190, partial [Actinobacteria bacterium]|nr:hypothetical protein [Actinomycetota bacterium]